MDVVAVAIEEYKSVRQESLEAVARLQTIAQYGLAAAGVAIGIALVSAAKSVTIGALLLMALIPLLAIFGGAMMANEAQRVGRAHRHLCHLERYVNSHFPSVAGPLSWETALVDGTSSRVLSYRMTIFVVVVGTLFIGPGIGGYLLAQDGLWTAFAISEALDLALTGAFAYWSLNTFARINDAFHPDDGNAPAPSLES
jgi:hypothetical protein